MAFNDLFLRAARLESIERTPVWMMRQAGRYMSEYRAIREKHGFLEMCYNPELAVEVSMQPVDLVGVDAAIMFSDILVVFPGMGLDLEFKSGVGPIINNPVRTMADIQKLGLSDPIDDTGYVMETIKILRHELENKVPLIGFAGAPFTLASYAVEGRGTRDYENCKALMWGDPVAWDSLMNKFTETVIAYLCAQIDAGAQVVQMFDSWVGYVAPRDYERFVLPYSQRVLAAVKAHGDKVVPDGGVPVIHFANGATSMLDLVQKAGGDIVGVDWRLDMKKAVELIDPKFGIQGNIDPVALFAPDAALEEMVVEILEAVGTRPGHIFNLGHGIHKTSDPEKARTMIRLVHEHSERIRAGV
ncbi:MAG: uroporphyrinogen decarboxylase [Actinobacteria bacterium HGW-Actinobacteria-7]|jgi:uroporphyrinogen decarboxylase|nr:MAG: uroporphyrinogen decarboxylase [Actinobacteria bacterium HGW-Actinobacteria-7]